MTQTVTNNHETRTVEPPVPLQPQLVMVRLDLRHLPAVALPAGYAIRSYRPGDEAAWEAIIGQSFGQKMRPNEFDLAMKADPAFRPERVLFVTHDGVPVATASAWQVPRYDADAGYLHMVGVQPGHQGKRLGLWVSLAALHHFVTEGRRTAVLQTDDFRLPALKIYLQLGFQPRLVHENQQARWRSVFKLLGQASELEQRFAALLTEPLEPAANTPEPPPAPARS